MERYWLKSWDKQEERRQNPRLDGTVSRLTSLEWLDCNSLGSHASSSWLQLHTRKYHALLIAALPQFDDRWVVLNSLEESVLEGGSAEHFLSGHYYLGDNYDEQFAKILHFLDKVTLTLDGHICACYAGDGWRIAREVALSSSRNSVLIRYTIFNNGSRPLRFRLRPLLAIRNFHQLQRADSGVVYNTTNVAAGSCYEIAGQPDLPKLYLQSSLEAQHFAQNVWYYNILYPKECERGYDDQEDLFCPEYLEYELVPGRSELVIVGGTEVQNLGDGEKFADLWQREIANRLVERGVADGDNLISVLRAGASKFIVRRQQVAEKIIAGYPWFLSWGRDTMIALPGLTLYNGQRAAASSILTYYAKHLRDGLLPNYLEATPEHHAYNSADASLWWVWAVYQYWLTGGGDSAKVLKLWGSALVSIWRHYAQGTCYNIHVDEATGFLYVGSAEWNLTWMDAEVNGKPVTPRYGFAVELNALWYHCITFLSRLISESFALANSLLAKGEIELLAGQIAKFRAHFADYFWYDAEGGQGYLCDYFNKNERNHQLRPNQLWVTALTSDLLEPAQAKMVVEAADNWLFTPCGLRTLDPRDGAYRGRYQGNQIERDMAYHNGTVWPWLLGCFFESGLKYLDRAHLMDRWRECEQAFKQHLWHEECIGGVSEVFDGDAPHRPGGTVDQAWSVGELIRAGCMVRDASL